MLSNQLSFTLGFPAGSDSKESACKAGDLGLIPGLGRSPGGGHSNLHQYSCLENPPGPRRLAIYNPGGCKVSDRTEQLCVCVGVCVMYIRRFSFLKYFVLVAWCLFKSLQNNWNQILNPSTCQCQGKQKWIKQQKMLEDLANVLFSLSFKSTSHSMGLCYFFFNF